MVARSTGSVFADAVRLGAPEGVPEGRVAKAHVMARLFGTTARERVSRYELHGRIGEGAHGCVYRAFDPRLRRHVAIKVLRPGCGGAAPALHRARASAEAHGLARLQHPGVVAVYDVGVHEPPAGDPVVYIVMELVDGPDLDGWLRARPRAISEILRVGLSAGRGLSAAHRAGLVHRDIKPANVLVGPGGAAKIADFGLVARADLASPTARSARDRDEQTRLTATGHVLGTPLYMPPEQHEGGRVDARADQYALCVALWEALHGAPPFSGSSSAAVHAAKLGGPPDPPAGSAVPIAVSRVLARGLAVHPDARYPHVDALLAALFTAAPRGPKRRRAVVAASVAIGSVVAGASVAAIEPTPCGPAASEWRPEHAEAIEAAFSATGRTDARERAERVALELDDWHVRWHEASQAACSAGSAPATTSCLAAAWDERTALLSVLRDADARVVGGGATAVAMLASPEDCAADEPRPGAQGSAAVRRGLSKVKALQAGGREREAWMLAQEVLRSQAPGDPLWLETAFRVGRLQWLTGEGSAIATLERVHHEALAKDDARMAAAAGAQLLQIHARTDAGTSAAMWDRHTQAALERAGDPDDVRLVWLHGRAMLAQRTGRLPDAISAYDESVRIAERIGATEQAAVSLGMRGLARRDLGELSGAEADLRESLRRREDAIGSDDVRLHSTLQNLGSVLVASGAHAEARKVLERARELVTRHRGGAASEAIDILELLGLLAYEEGDLSRAAALLSEVLAARERGPDVLPRKRAHACFNLANVQAVRGELEVAAQLHREAVRWLEEGLGPEHPEVAYVLVALAEVERERGDVVAARRHLGRAEALLARVEIPGSRRAELDEIAAKVQAAEGGLR